jgi:hypothetical protein
LSNKRRNKTKQRKNSTVQKASSTPSRLPKKGVGTSGIAYYQQVINKIQPYELKYPQSMKTFEAMKNDDAISSVLNLTYALIENAFCDYKIKYNKNSSQSKKASEFLDYCFNSLDQQSFEGFIRNAATFKEKGFSIIEKIYKKDSSGEYAGLWRISKLANRPQISLDGSTPFEIDAGGRRIKACRQDVSYFQNEFNNNLFIETGDITGDGYKRIRRKKFMLFGDGATDSTPFGNPIFRSCYKAWKEKLLLEDLEVNGASKDLAGIIDLAIPNDILLKAANDPASPEATLVQDLMTSAANVHAGEQSYFIRPSDLQEGSNSVTEYAVKLLGLEGSGRKFDPKEMIAERRKAIFDIWGAGHTLTGEGSVSYNSAEVQSTIHMYHIKRDINVIVEVINKDLIPQLLNDMNDFGLSYKDMPKLEAGEIDKVSLDEASKMIQRIKSVNGLALTKDNIIQYHKWCGFDTRAMEDMSEEELYESMTIIDKGGSRAGESQGTSGTGNTQDSSGGDNNLENS